MKRQSDFLKIVTMVLVLFITGCAVITKPDRGAQVSRKVYPASFDNTWNAVKLALNNVPLEVYDKSTGRIKTEWIQADSDRKGTGLFFDKAWKVRNRFIISIDSLSSFNSNTEVSLTLQSEERAPAGERGIKWLRKPSNGSYERDLFEKIEMYLR